MTKSSRWLQVGQKLETVVEPDKNDYLVLSILSAQAWWDSLRPRD